MGFDEAALPTAARQLLALASGPAPTPARPAGTPLLHRVGLWAFSVFGAENRGPAPSSERRPCAAEPRCGGRASMRGCDLLDCMRDAGGRRRCHVTVVNLLVGGILAFVRRGPTAPASAPTSIVASLVGIAVVREMAALMTAIIMAGRTGGAYAANIATMQGNEEIDALRAVGIPVFDYLILPRVLALTG